MKNVNDFISDLKDILDNRLLSVFVFGATANSSDRILIKNVDLFIIIDNWKPDDLFKIHTIVKVWMVKGNPCPIIMSKEEFYDRSETFAMEYSDIKWNYQLLYGDDFVEPLNVNYFDLKLQCDRELKNLALKLRNFYLENGRSKSAILPFSNAVIRSLIVIFRVILRLNNITPSVYKHDVLDQVADIIKFDKLFFKKMLDFKEGSYRFSASEIYEFNDYLIGQVAYIQKQLQER